MKCKALLMVGFLLTFSAPAAADRCSYVLAQVNEVLAIPEQSRVVRETVDGLVRQARTQRKAGNEKACIAKLAAVKRILRLE